MRSGQVLRRPTSPLSIPMWDQDYVQAQLKETSLNRKAGRITPAFSLGRFLTRDVYYEYLSSLQQKVDWINARPPA